MRPERYSARVLPPLELYLEDPAGRAHILPAALKTPTISGAPRCLSFSSDKSRLPALPSYVPSFRPSRVSEGGRSRLLAQLESQFSEVSAWLFGNFLPFSLKIAWDSRRAKSPQSFSLPRLGFWRNAPGSVALSSLRFRQTVGRLRRRGSSNDAQKLVRENARHKGLRSLGPPLTRRSARLPPSRRGRTRELRKRALNQRTRDK